MQSTSTYVYSPVDSNAAEIRLLTIPFDVRQVLGHRNSKPLSGRLKNHYLPVSGLSRGERLMRSTRLPLFLALSYVWGNSDRTHEIIIDGKRLPITQNLYIALRDIQAASPVGDVRVWADAICINQEDQGERSAQIPLMREIYHMAAFVRIWLGPSSPEARKCAKFIAYLTDAGRSPDDEPTDQDPSRLAETIYKGIALPLGALVNGGIAFGQNMIQLMDIVDPNYRDGKAQMLQDPDGSLSLQQETIEELAKWRPSDKQLKKLEEYGDFTDIGNLINKVLIEENNWFERMWVVQEVGVAETVEFQIGNYALEWDSFVCAVHYLHYVRKVRIHCIRRVTGLEKIRMGYNAGKRQPLRDLIRETRSRGATDPRDKVYSLLGLMGDPLTKFLKPDYSRSVNEIYAKVTLHFIEQNRSLDPICEQKVIGRRDGLPSWVPDYSLEGGATVSHLVAIDGHKSLYAASGYDHRSNYLSSPRLEFWRRLSTHGIYVDSVIESEELGFGRGEDSASTESWSSVLGAASKDGRLQKFTEGTFRWLSTLPALISQCNAGEHHFNDEYTEFCKNLPLMTEIPLMREIISTLLIGRISPRKRLSQEHFDALFHCDPSNVMGQSPQSTKVTEDFKSLEILGALRVTKKSKASAEPKDASHKVSAAQIDEPDTLYQMYRSIGDSMKSRRLIVTKNGHLGAVPQYTRMGDMICILFGCSVPVVLRRCQQSTDDSSKRQQKLDENKAAVETDVKQDFEDSKVLNDNNVQDEEYTFIGECYLHNFMDAEALTLPVNGEHQVQEFVLC